MLLQAVLPQNDVKQCLLSVRQNGKMLHAEFNLRLTNISNESQQKMLFFDSIKRVKWKDFSCKEKKTKVTSSTGKTLEVAVQRDNLGFLVAKSQEMNLPINIDEALKYPLCPVPLSIAHGDDEKRKTTKGDLMKYAFSSTEVHQIPQNKKDVYILNLAAIFRSTLKVPNTFEDLATKILLDIPHIYQLIYIACGTYRDPFFNYSKI